MVTPLTMLLRTPVGRLGSSIGRLVDKAIPVGRISLTMLLTADGRLPRSLTMVDSAAGTVATMLETAPERPVPRGRSVGRTSLTMLLTAEGTMVASEAMSLTKLVAAAGISPRSDAAPLRMLETGRVVGTEMSLTPERTTLAMLETGRPGRIGSPTPEFPVDEAAGEDEETAAELCDTPAEALTLADALAAIEALTLAETEAETPFEAADDA